MSSALSHASVRKAHLDDFEEVYPLLLDFRNPRLTKDDWRQLFINHWESPEDYCGYVLVDRKKIVGFIGTIFSKRHLQGKEYKFCNISSWIVKREHRNKSLYLFFPLLGLSDYTLTSLTVSKNIYNIYAKLNFNEMASSVHLFPLLPVLSLFGISNECKVIYDYDIIETYLSPTELVIFEDHKKFKCKSLLLKSNKGNCYLVITKVERIRLPFVYVHFISNLPVYEKFIHKVAFQILWHCKAVGLIVDERLLQGYKTCWGAKYKLPHFKFYRSSSLMAEDIDNLYSELILLNL